MNSKIIITDGKTPVFIGNEDKTSNKEVDKKEKK